MHFKCANMYVQQPYESEAYEYLMSIGTGAILPDEKQMAVHRQFEEVAKAKPSRIAVKSVGVNTSYGQLYGWASAIASRLDAADVPRGSRIAVFAERSAKLVAGILGIMKYGSAYVPLDLELPDRRVAEVLDDADVACVLVSRSVKSRLTASRWRLVDVDDLDGASGSGLSPEADELHSPAYVIYTSGSTGEPKGVVVAHGQLSASTLARRCVYPDVPTFLLMSSFAFDSSMAGLWSALTVGGCVVVASSQEMCDPARLIGLVQCHRITHILCVPSLYDVMLDAAARRDETWNHSLKGVILAGEPLHERLVQRHFDQCPSAPPIFNEYGPTEATIWASYYRFNAPGPVTLGRPIPGARIYILDDGHRLLPPNSIGELYIGGAGVSCGYHGRPDATADAFLKDPFSAADGARMYRTGDLGCWNADGTLTFRGRRDEQVKVRGHRVELGAIESTLKSLEGVRDAVVVAKRAPITLTAFVVAEAPLVERDLRQYLAERLPSWMVPSRISLLDHLPRLLTGKVDRAQLQARADVDVVSVSSTRSRDSDSVFAQVAASWSEILGLDDVPGTVNFFDLGGNSLQMFALQEALERHTGTRLTVIDLFRHSTVAAQTDVIRNGRVGSVDCPSDGDAVARSVLALRSVRTHESREA